MMTALYASHLHTDHGHHEYEHSMPMLLQTREATRAHRK